jgi:hypothetical protein
LLLLPSDGLSLRLSAWNSESFILPVSGSRQLIEQSAWIRAPASVNRISIAAPGDTQPNDNMKRLADGDGLFRVRRL